jgi:hypothetical protein
VRGCVVRCIHMASCYEGMLFSYDCTYSIIFVLESRAVLRMAYVMRALYDSEIRCLKDT